MPFKCEIIYHRNLQSSSQALKLNNHNISCQYKPYIRRNHLKSEKSKKMLKRRTFTSEIREFLIILSIFGLWPSGHTSKYRFFFAIYSILSMLLAVFICISALFILRIFEDSTLSVAVAYSFVLSGLFAHSVIIAQAFFYRNEQQRLVTKFAYVDELLQKKLRVNLSYDKEKRQILIRILAISFTLFAIKIAFFGHLYLRNAFQLQALGFWLHCMYSVFIMRLRCLQVLVFVLLLRSRINILNTKVKEILMTHNRHLGLSSTRWTSASDGKEVIFLLDVSTKFHSTYDRLLYIKQIYGELYEICEWMNMTFGWSLLAIVTQCFVEFTSVRLVVFMKIS